MPPCAQGFIGTSISGSKLTVSFKGHADLVVVLGARSDETVEVDVWGDKFAAALVSDAA